MKLLWLRFLGRLRYIKSRFVLRRRTRKLGLRHVFSNADGHYALTRDNRVVLLSDPMFPEFPPPLQPIPVDGHLQRITYILAAHMDPTLVHLIPARGPGDTTCPDCGGSGRMPHPPEELVHRGHSCWCAGIGWLPDGEGPFAFQ